MLGSVLSPFNSTTLDKAVGWTTFPIRKKAKIMWHVALSSLCWTIWKERNMVVFDNVIFFPRKVETLLYNIPYLLSRSYL